LLFDKDWCEAAESIRAPEAAVINEVDESLRNLLKAEALSGTDVDVVLDAPTREWAARHSAPMIDMYLYDIREDLGRRQSGLLPQYDDEGRIEGHLSVPRFVKLSYLVTAWTQRPEDEHRLLTSVLWCLLENEVIPEERLTEPLRSKELPIGIVVAQPGKDDRKVSDVWTALGGDLKPSLDLVTTVRLDIGIMREAARLVQAPMRLRTVGMEPEDNVEDEIKHLRHQEAAATAAPATPTNDHADAAVTKSGRSATKKVSGATKQAK
jgi:hypothetical protein